VRRALEAFVLDPRRAPLPPLLVLQRARLAALTGTLHPERAELRPSVAAAEAAHAAAFAAVAPLLAAWSTAGVEALVFKGLALALHGYERPVQRWYEDVDVLLHPSDIPIAERVAHELGWTVRWSAKVSGNRYSHEALHLLSPDRALLLDVHRFVVHSYAPWSRPQARLTEAAWAASSELAMGHARARVLDPRDAVLMGLVLNRAWSTDAWRLKPRDYVDFCMLVERHGLTPEALHARARELGCGRTLELFLRRCDPFERRLDLRPPTRAQRLRWSLAVAHERRPYRIDHAANLFLIAPGVLRDTLRELPGLVRVLRLLRAEPDVGRLLAHPGRAQQGTPPPRRAPPLPRRPRRTLGPQAAACAPRGRLPAALAGGVRQAAAPGRAGGVRQRRAASARRHRRARLGGTGRSGVARAGRTVARALRPQRPLPPRRRRARQ
jgi:hypothetical protein